jgi:1,4-alpha-glucan branching enzyme
MGWMHDTLKYFQNDPIHRKYHHNQLTFRMLYSWHENFVLPLSHDEVVYGKRSLLAKMPGDEWQQFANLRLLFAYQFGFPGKQLLFMGGEFGQWNEWNHDVSLDWHLLQYPFHSGLQRWVRDLNTFYRGQPSLYEVDFDPSGFEWIDCNDVERSVVSFIRRAKTPADMTLIVLNCTPVARENYRLGAPLGGYWRECLNSDAPLYGGSGQGNVGGVEAVPLPVHGRPYSLSLTLPPLGALFLRHAGNPEP